GRAMYVTPGVVVDGELVTTSLVDITLGIRILLGSSYYEDWVNEETFVQRDPLGNDVDQRHPWNQTTIPAPQKRDLDGGKYSWVMSPRWLHEGEHLALDTGGGPLARLWSTALAGRVDTPYVKSTGSSVQINLPRSAQLPEMTFEWKIPEYGSNTIERDRARSYFIGYAAGIALFAVERALAEIRQGHTKVFESFEVPDEAIGCGFHEAVRGVLSHHVVIRDGKIANYHPYPPTPWNASPRDVDGTPGPYEDAVQNTPIFEENGPDKFKGIDIMRTVRSFARHGSGLRAGLAHLGEAGTAGAPVRDALARAAVVSGLLLLHGLHPLGLEARVLQALDQVRPRLRSHGGGVELLGADAGVV